jgi:hypothetical protein
VIINIADTAYASCTAKAATAAAAASLFVCDSYLGSNGNARTSSRVCARAFDVSSRVVWRVEVGLAAHVDASI